jgi:hypothetical protein
LRQRGQGPSLLDVDLAHQCKPWKLGRKSQSNPNPHIA